MIRSARLRICLALALAFAVAATSTGCYSKTEIEQTAFVLAIGLDRGREKPLRLVAQIAVPPAIAGESGGGGQLEAVLLSAEGRTVSEAILELSKVTPSKLFWGHADIIVMTADFVEHGLVRKTDIFLREREFRPGAFVFITHDELEDVLAVKYPAQPGNAAYVQQLADLTSTHSTSPQAFIAELGILISVGTGAMLIPIITVDESAASSGVDKPLKTLRLSGSGVVNGDGLLAELTAVETRGVLWAIGKVRETIITLEDPGDLTGSLGIRVFRSWSHISIEIDHQRIEDSKVLVSINGDADIIEAHLPGVYLSSAEVQMVNGSLSEAVAREVRNSLRLLQHVGADALGLAELFRRSMPAARWKEVKAQWDQVFSQIEFSVTVDLRIRRRGMAA